jgi:hypothetical protein
MARAWANLAWKHQAVDLVGTVNIKHLPFRIIISISEKECWLQIETNSSNRIECHVTAPAYHKSLVIKKTPSAGKGRNFKHRFVIFRGYVFQFIFWKKVCCNFIYFKNVHSFSHHSLLKIFQQIFAPALTYGKFLLKVLLAIVE